MRAQNKHSEQPSSSLPGVSVPEADPYDGDTEPEIETQVSPKDSNASTTTNSKSIPKKGSISITSHALKMKTTSRKYRCRMCSAVLDSVHHQTNHNILYCSMCSKAFNNLLSLVRHEYEHKHKDLKCPKCDCKFSFKSQVRAHMLSHCNEPSFFYVYPGCDKKFFNQSDLTRHSKRHNGKAFQCLDCLYRDTDKRNFDSHRLSHSRIANYK